MNSTPASIRRLWTRGLFLALLVGVAGWVGACGPMAIHDDLPYLGKSNDGRESTVVRLQFAENGTRAAFTAELPSGEQCTGIFRRASDSRPWGFLPPPTRDFVGLLDSGLSAPCEAWAGSAKDQGLLLRVTYHPVIGRYRVGLTRKEDARRVAGDWIMLDAEPPPQNAK